MHRTGVVFCWQFMGEWLRVAQFLQRLKDIPWVVRGRSGVPAITRKRAEQTFNVSVEDEADSVSLHVDDRRTGVGAGDIRCLGVRDS